MTFSHLNLKTDLNFKDLEVLCSAAHQRSVAPRYLGRTVTVWDNAGSRIRKFAQGCLKAYRTAALRAAAIEGGTEIDFTHIKKYENYLGKTGLVMSYLSYTNTLISLKNVRAQIASLARRAKKQPDNLDLQDQLKILRERQMHLKKEIGLSSTILGLGMGSMLCQTLALKGLRAAPYVGAIIGGVETFMNLGGKLNGLCKVIAHYPQKDAIKKTQENRIVDLYMSHRSNFDLKTSRSAGLLRDMRFVKIQSGAAIKPFDFAISLINWLNLLVNSATTSILIAGVFGAVAATAAVGSLNIASLALLGIGLAAIALKWVHVNQYGWKLSLEAMIVDWKIHNREKVRLDLTTKIEVLKDQKKIALESNPKNAKRLRLKFEQIDEELRRLESRKQELISEKMNEVFRIKFGKSFDLQSVELLKDAALDLRNDVAGVQYLKDFFMLFGKNLHPAQLKSSVDLTVQEMGHLLMRMHHLKAEEMMNGSLISDQQKKIFDGDFSPLQSLAASALASLNKDLQLERERQSRISFLEKFASLFTTA